MDFIERIFGFAPDGGSGSLEFLLSAIPVAGITYLVVRRRQRTKEKKQALRSAHAVTGRPQVGSSGEGGHGRGRVHETL